MLTLCDRVRGTLVGAALGDAFGAPFEGMSSTLEREIALRAERRRPWRYTDDTEMTLAVARTLANGRELEPASLLAELADAFDPMSAHGSGMRCCVEAYRRGVPWWQCAFASWPEGSAGNGAAARVAPVACRYWDDRDGLLCGAALSSRVTHAHRDAILGAMLQAVSVALCLRSAARSFSSDAFLCELARRRLGGWTDGKLAHVATLLDDDAPPAIVAAELGNGVLAVEAVPAALWAFLRGAPSFEQSILCAARLGGDVDTICGLTGALAGALCGRAALPRHWLANLQRERPGVVEIDALALDLVGRVGLRAAVG